MHTQKLMILALLCYVSTSLLSQEISRSTQPSAGASAKNAQGYSMTWTMGAQFSQIVKDNNHLTEGFQQGDLQPVIKRSEEQAQALQLVSTKKTITDNRTRDIPFDMTIYPNPTVEKLSVSFKQDFPEAEIFIFDHTGKKILNQTIVTTQGASISIQKIDQLPAGHYFIQVIAANHSSKSLPFVKVK